MMKLSSDDSVVITGAASGIGRALARAVHARGARAALLDVDGDGLAALERELPGATAHRCDVAQPAAVEEACTAVLAVHPGLRAVVNNAGISATGTIEELPLAQFEKTLAVNFWGVLHMCRTFLPHLRARAGTRGGAAIVNVLSDFALFSLPTKAPYAASKHAARALTEALGAELADSGVQVMAVYPGATATDLVRRGYATDRDKQATEAEFLARGLSPEAVAEQILRGLERGRTRLLVGRDTRAIDFAQRLSPRLLAWGIRRYWRRVPFL